MQQFQIKTESLYNLINHARNKSIELPSFQRNFVWEIEDQKSLIASIFCEIPASSFLIYKGNTDFFVKDIGNNSTALRKSTPGASQLLDGQQRFTTIYSVFHDLYDNNSNPSNYFSRIRNRWFIKMNTSPFENDIFNLGTFNFSESKITNDSSTDNIKDALTTFQVDESESIFHYEKSLNQIRQLCINYKYIPLFFLTEKLVEIRQILSAIANLHKSLIIQWLDTKVQNEIITRLIIENPNDKFDDYDNNKRDCDDRLTALSIAWTENVRDYFSSFLQNYNQSIIEIKNTNKIVEAFYIINTTGSKLTTFDLLCAKINSIDLRGTINESIEVKYKTKLRNGDNHSISTKDILKIWNKKDGINHKYYQIFSQALGLYYFLKIKNKTIQVLSADDIKSDRILSIDPNDIDITVINNVAEIVDRTLIFLATQCSLRSISKITNDLALIPIMCAVITTNRFNWNKSNEILLIIKKFYFQRLLIGNYNTNQNNNCIADSKLLAAIISENSPKKLRIRNTTDDYNLEIETQLFKNEFLKKGKICHFDPNDIPNKSAVSNILYFLESFTINNSGLTDFTLQTKYISYKDDVDIHHIIPIGSLANKYSAEYQKDDIRKNPAHRMNSVMNKTIITKVTNQKIGNSTVAQYTANIQNPEIIGSHLLTNDFKDSIAVIPKKISNPLTQDEEKLKILFETRFDKLELHAIQNLKI